MPDAIRPTQGQDRFAPHGIRFLLTHLLEHTLPLHRSTLVDTENTDSSR